MADDPQPVTQDDLKIWGSQLLTGALATIGATGATKAAATVHADSKGTLYAIIHDVSVQLAVKMGATLHEIEEPFLPIIAGFVAPIIAGLFGADVNAGEFAQRMAKGNGAAAAESIVDGLMKAIAGADEGEIAPSPAGSQRIAAAAVQASLESTFNAIVPELLSDLLPEIGPHFTAFTELPESIIRTLGVSRLVRRALSPLIDTTCATPMKWYIDKRHRPTLLGAGETARQLARGRWTREKATEELARAGYSDDRIEALLNSVAKFRSAPDAFRLVRAGQWSETEAEQHLKDQGYDDDGAVTELLLEKLKAIESFERSMASAAVDAFAARRIDEGELGGFVSGATISAQEKAQYVELAHARRILSTRSLSLSQVETMVKSKVLSVPDYRDAARREGYDELAVTALELQLRWEMDKAKDVETHRAELEAQRAAEKKAKADAAAAKRAEIEAARALAQRGKRADLERAAIRGLVSLDRVQEIYAATYDADTAAILMQLLEADRQTYLEQQAARDAAAKRAAVRGVDVGALEAAVLEGVLTLDDLRARLAQLHFTADDAAILVETLAAKIQDKADAEAARADAAAAAKVKHVDLSVVEMLVRRGHRTIAQYDAVLSSLGFDDGARAAMVERLQLLIDDDAAAREAHAAAVAKASAKGVSFDQARRAVILGVSSIDAFQTFLVSQGFTPDAQQVLLAELRFDVAEADAARTRRTEADAAKDTRDAPLSDVARAARLGLIPVAVYQARLVRSNYSDDDVAIEMDLLVHEMADLAVARDKRAASEGASQSHGLSLAQVERAVRAGQQSLAAYRAAALASGLDVDAADVLTNTLSDELAARAAADQRRAEIAAAAATKRLSLAQLEAAVKAGLATLDDYRAFVLELGYADEDAALLVGLLAQQLGVIQEAQDRRDQAPARHPTQHATLAQLEQSVKDGIITMAAFIGELRSRGFGEAPLITIDADGRAVLDESSDGPFDDAELIALLLQVQLDAKAAKAGG